MGLGDLSGDYDEKLSGVHAMLLGHVFTRRSEPRSSIPMSHHMLIIRPI